MLPDFVRYGLLGPPITLLNEFKPPPYGGGNQFLSALIKSWKKVGMPIYANRIGPSTRYILFNSYNFDMDWLRGKVGTRPEGRGRRLLHRVDGPIGTYRGQGPEIDIEIARINSELADVTVFQSEYSLRMHHELGLTFQRPEVIRNTVDPEIFHPRGRASYPREGGRTGKIHLIASAWSNNVHKGAKVYEWLDQNLDFTKFEMTFVGRINSEFKNIRFVPAVPSLELAELLRGADLYITASANDPCSNALLEGLACGLPAIYLDSGGHGELVGGAGLGFKSPEEIPELLTRMTKSPEVYADYQRKIEVGQIDVVARAYLALLLGKPEAREPGITAERLGF